MVVLGGRGRSHPEGYRANLILVRPGPIRPLLHMKVKINSGPLFKNASS
jgi:hypothetical protein